MTILQHITSALAGALLSSAMHWTRAALRAARLRPSHEADAAALAAAVEHQARTK